MTEEHLCRVPERADSVSKAWELISSKIRLVAYVHDRDGEYT